MLELMSTKLIERIRSTSDLLVNQEFNSIERIAGISEEDLKGYVAVNETITAIGEYLNEDAKAKDELTRKLNELQEQMKEVNSKLKDLEEINEKLNMLTGANKIK